MKLAIAELKKGDVKDMGLADAGKRKIEWAGQQMPVLESIRERFAKEQPLKGLRISACLHVTSETANLMIALRAGGAETVLCASNPLSTQDEVAASLNRDHGIPTFAIKGEDNDTYYSHLSSALEHKPQFTMDDGADLVTMLLTKRTDLVPNVVGGTEGRSCATPAIATWRSTSRRWRKCPVASAKCVRLWTNTG